MRWHELNTSLPFLRQLRSEMRACAARLLGPHGALASELFPEDGDVERSDVLALLNWQELRRTQRACASTATAQTKWAYLAGTHLGGRDWVIFKNSTNELVRLPADFVGAFLRDERLCVDLVPSHADPQILLLQRAGATEAAISATLLDHLLEVRTREGKGAWPWQASAASELT